MARYQLNLAYDGTEFQGSQRQGQKRTVQLEVERSLKKLGWNGKAILLAGRTDAGVHASGQTAAFDLVWQHSLIELKRAINAGLPADVSVVSIARVQTDFHPRFDATARMYRYSIYCQPERDPLKDRYAWQIEKPLNWRLLRAAAKALIGTHDFGEFGRAMKPGNPTIRTVMKAEWKRVEADRLEFEVTADAFLYHMVRRMVFLVTLVGQGRIDLQDLKDAVNHKKKLNPGMAPAKGLCLVKVIYDQKADKVVEGSE